LLAPQLGDAPGGIGGPSSAGGGPGAGEPPPGNIILEPLAYRWLAVPFLLLLLFVLPSLAAAEERLFRQGTRGWRQGLVRSLIFGLAHWPMGIPLGAALALSIGGLWFTYQYFRGGIARSTVYHLTYNLLAILLIVLLLVIPWGCASAAWAAAGSSVGPAAGGWASTGFSLGLSAGRVLQCPAMEELAFRQIHLDFHTSGDIPGVGDDFDPDEFATILREAHVTSVTCFAKCHHGYSYYPTKIGVPHPNLHRDLLGEQVEALKRAGIRVPAYLSVVWDEHAAAMHQEWLQIDTSGRTVGRGPLEARGWRWLCMNTAYVDYVAARAEEVLRTYPVDGLFFDIVRQTDPRCICNRCRADLARKG